MRAPTHTNAQQLPEQMPTGSGYLTLKQASEYTALSQRTLRRYIAENKLTAYRAGRLIRLRQEDLDALFTSTNNWAQGVS